MGRTSFKAVIIGNAVSIILPFLCALVLSLFALSTRPAGMSIHDARNFLSSLLWFNLSLIGCGALSFAAAGYVAAKYSDRDLLLNGILATVFAIAWNVYDLVTHHASRFDSIGTAIVS
jgi:hypothetical protein